MNSFYLIQWDTDSKETIQRTIQNLRKKAAELEARIGGQNAISN